MHQVSKPPNQQNGLEYILIEQPRADSLAPLSLRTACVIISCHEVPNCVLAPRVRRVFAQKVGIFTPSLVDAHAEQRDNDQALHGKTVGL